MIDDVVCLDIENSSTNDYCIKPNINSSLSELSEKIKVVEKKMKKNLTNVNIYRICLF